MIVAKLPPFPTRDARPLTLGADDLHLVRQWFNALQDLNGAYLEPGDYELADRIAAAIGWETIGRPGKGRP